MSPTSRAMWLMPTSRGRSAISDAEQYVEEAREALLQVVPAEAHEAQGTVRPRACNTRLAQQTQVVRARGGREAELVLHLRAVVLSAVGQGSHDLEPDRVAHRAKDGREIQVGCGWVADLTDGYGHAFYATTVFPRLWKFGSD